MMTSSILIASFRRVDVLERCLRALARQTVKADEVIVAWQADDTATRDVVERLAAELPMNLLAVHSEEAGVVAAENAALEHASGTVVLLIDDDAVAPPGWLARHLAHYDDETVGAVGGPADNYTDDRRYPVHDVEPVGRITWWGRFHGNMYDQPEAWRSRPPREVDHLVGYNLSLRRAAFDRFEAGLKRYWQSFEADACLQVKARGYRVLFDFGNVVEHRMKPRATVYSPGRDGDLEIKVGNSAYNVAFVLSKHTAGRLQRGVRWLYLLLVGTTSAPGLLLWPLTVARHGNPLRELRLVRMSWASRGSGWRGGRRRREAAPR